MVFIPNQDFPVFTMLGANLELRLYGDDSVSGKHYHNSLQRPRTE